MTSANLGLDLQTTGSNNGTWGLTLNSDLTIIDSRLGARVSVACDGAANITVSASQAQNFFHTMTGVLTGNIKYILPATGGIYFIRNNTSGAFTITVVNNAAGTGVIIPQGVAQLVISNPDTTTVFSPITSFPSLTVSGTTTLSSLNTAGVVTTDASGVLSTNATLPTARMPALTGDVTTASGAVATTIANSAVTLAKMADMATASLLGRNTAGTGAPEVLSATTSRSLLGLGTAATLNVGTGANNIVQLDGSSRLPAVNGSLLTNVAGVPVVTSGAAGKIVFGAVTYQWGSGTGSSVTFGTAFSGTPWVIHVTNSVSTAENTSTFSWTSSGFSRAGSLAFSWTAIGPT